MLPWIRLFTANQKTIIGKGSKRMKKSQKWRESMTMIVPQSWNLQPVGRSLFGWNIGIVDVGQVAQAANGFGN